MNRLSEKDLESFIRRNRDKFGDYSPHENHMDRFIFRFRNRFRKIVSIVPYLARVAIATVVIFVASVIVWNSFIRKDRHEKTLVEKITGITDSFKR